MSVRACVEGSGWPKGGVVARHRCVSDVICGCHGDAIDWPTRRQTSRESRRHSDYCPSPRPSDYTPTSTPSSSSFTPIHPVSRERRGALLSSPPSRAFTTNVVHSHATPIPAPRAQTRPNTLDTRLTTESRLPGNLNFPSVPNATNTVNDLLFLLEAKEEPLFAREKQRKKYQLSAPLRLSDTTVGRTGHL